ncbi:MAG TPA: serine hydrolase domain-containing protein [Verrucomicrobiae bacterium]
MHLEKSEFPSLAAAVVRGSNIVAAGVTGVRKIGADEKVTLNDKFHIGSCTKSMTALLAVYLEQEGKIRLTNRVGDVLKDWTIPDESRDITLDLLLQNRSGLSTQAEPKLWGRAFADSGSPAAQRRRFLEGTLGEGLEAKPGTKYIYSNQGYSLAGAMLETAAGNSWEKLIEQKVFRPLDLKTGGFGPPSTSGEVDQPWGHIWKSGKADAVPPSDNPTAIAPAGAVHLSIIDAAKYAAFHLQVAQGKVPALKDYVDDLYSPPDKGEYAFGWGVSKRGWAKGKVLNHAGSNTMFFIVIWIAPEIDWACVVATNVADRRNEVAGGCDAVVAGLIAKYVQKNSK